jgi:NAD(P)-dependent dehydrogenase (short-subunit alcohol dehydrogenase family)
MPSAAEAATLIFKDPHQPCRGDSAAQAATDIRWVELQFGTNYLWPFALTAQLLPLLRKERNPRVVPVSSIADRSATINFDDLQTERDYKPMPVYGQSKACRFDVRLRASAS